MNPDMVNGLFEMAGAAFVCMHAHATWRARSSAGISLLACFLFAVWGAWNLFYYPWLGQFWSFAGGILVFIANIAWLTLVIRFRPRGAA